MSKFPIILAITAAIFSLGYFVFVSDAAAYGGNTPENCANCHVMDSQYENWYHGAHENFAKCTDCHLPHDNFAVYYAEKGRRRIRSRLWRGEFLWRSARMKRPRASFKPIVSTVMKMLLKLLWWAPSLLTVIAGIAIVTSRMAHAALQIFPIKTRQFIRSNRGEYINEKIY